MNIVFVTLILILIICTIIIITGICTNWSLPQNLVNDSRGWAEMCFGMFAFSLSNIIRKNNFNSTISLILKIIEIICYNVPVILGFAPINTKYMTIIMAITVMCSFLHLQSHLLIKDM